ncbi:MAG: carbohydrate kinase family protein [Candidatus Helarchaeota archaeon]
MKLDIICEGAALVDIVALVERFPKIDDEVYVPKLQYMCGGSAANTAVACVKLNLKTGFIGKIGTDPFGELLIDDFKRNSINIDNLIISKTLPTGNCYVAVDKTGNRVLYAFSGAANELSPEEINPEYIKNSKLIHLASLKNLDPLIKSAEIAKNNNVLVSLNPGALIADQPYEKIKPLLLNIDIFIGSEKELEKIFDKEYGKAINELGKFVNIAAITRGHKGSVVKNFQTDESFEIPPFKVDVKDTTGAGDAFSAGFLAGILHEKDLYTCGKMGNATAALCIQKVGARSGLPNYNDLMNFIEKEKKD